ncbi:MAG: hypothetical protein IPK97_07185 [Ahniella sp.]|nr:hypothetical protein [Ahniella sp.]
MLRLIDRRQPASAEVWSTSMAGRIVHSNFRIDPGASVRVAAQMPEFVPEPPGQPSTTIDAQLGGTLHKVRISAGVADQRRFQFEHGLTLRIAGQTAEVTAPTEESRRDVVEALLGPGLLLLCARHGAFALHAAAVADTRGIVLLAGPSGQGKSSLARLAANPIAGPSGPILRVADDLVVLGGDFGFCTNVPQLKLDPILLPAPVSTHLRNIVWPEFDDAITTPVLRPLSPVEMRLRLIRDSVAARLFDANELAAHLGWVTRLSQHVPGFVLRRPRVDPALIGIANRHSLDLLIT